MLVYDQDSNDKGEQRIRDTFHKNLAKEKLHLEIEENVVSTPVGFDIFFLNAIFQNVANGKIHTFVKVHIPWPILSKYAELMRLRVPIEVCYY